MSAEIWQPDKRDITRCGQCVDDVAAHFPEDKKAARMVEVWKRWHLNDMRAGCEHQRAEGWNERPIDPCPTCGYKYGSAWLHEEIPAEVVAEIESWST